MNVASQISTSIDIAAATNAGTPIIAASPTTRRARPFRNLVDPAGRRARAWRVGRPRGRRVRTTGATDRRSPSSSGSRGDIVSSLAERLAAAAQAERAPARRRRLRPRAAGSGPRTPASRRPRRAPPARQRQLRRRRRRAAARADAPRPVPTRRGQRRRGSAEHDRLEELKQDVHAELLQQLGPQLYDANLDQDELDHRVRTVLADSAGSQDGRSATPTATGSPRRSATTSSATARSSRSCATRTSPRSWSTAPTRI